MYTAWTRVFTRPISDVLWWHEILERDYPDYCNYIRETYIIPGKMAVEREVSGDGLILISKFLFSDSEIEAQFYTDPKPQEILILQNKFLQDNNIQVVT